MRYEQNLNESMDYHENIEESSRTIENRYCKCGTRCINAKPQSNKLFKTSSSCRTIFISSIILFIMLGNVQAGFFDNNVEKTKYNETESWRKAMKEYFEGSRDDIKINEIKYDLILKMEKYDEGNEEVTTDIPSEETTKSWLQFMEEDAMNNYDGDSNETELHRYRRDIGEGSGSGFESTTTAQVEETTAEVEGSGITTESNFEDTTITEITEMNTTPYFTTITSEMETTPTTITPVGTTFQPTSQYQTMTQTEMTAEVTSQDLVTTPDKVETTFSGDESTVEPTTLSDFTETTNFETVTTPANTSPIDQTTGTLSTTTHYETTFSGDETTAVESTTHYTPTATETTYFETETTAPITTTPEEVTSEQTSTVFDSTTTAFESSTATAETSTTAFVTLPSLQTSTVLDSTTTAFESPTATDEASTTSSVTLTSQRTSTVSDSTTTAFDLETTTATASATAAIDLQTSSGAPLVTESSSISVSDEVSTEGFLKSTTIPETTPTTQPPTDLCTTDPDNCPTNQFCVETSTINQCQCMPGLTEDSNGNCNEPVKQFGGQLHVETEYNDDLDDPSSDYYKEQEEVYRNVVDLAYEDEPWYLGCKILGFKRGSTVALYEVTTKDDETVNSSTIETAFAEFLTNDTYFPDDCSCSSTDCNTEGLGLSGPLLSNDSCNDAGGASEVLCSQSEYSQYCDPTSSSCSATSNGNINCECKSGFVSNPDTPNSCIKQVCQFSTNSGCNAPFGQCSSTQDGVGKCVCMWGFYGTNCYEPWLFVFVVVISGLVFIAIIVIVVYCVKKRRSAKSWKNSTKYYDDVIYENDGKIARDGVYKNLYEWDQQTSSVLPKSYKGMNSDFEPYDNNSHLSSVHEINDRNGHGATVKQNPYVEQQKLDDWITTEENAEPNSRRYEYAQENHSYQVTEDEEIDNAPPELSTFTYHQTKL